MLTQHSLCEAMSGSKWVAFGGLSAMKRRNTGGFRAQKCHRCSKLVCLVLHLDLHVVLRVCVATQRDVELKSIDIILPDQLEQRDPKVGRRRPALAAAKQCLVEGGKEGIANEQAPFWIWGG